MAAPNSSPELSVVTDPEQPEPARDSKQAAEAEPEPDPEPAERREMPSERPASVPPTAAASPQRRSRGAHGAPWWLVGAVAITGLALFFGQYLRAERLDARVQALRTELEEAGMQLAAYQSHLDHIRLGVDDLAALLGSLQELVESDPLAPPPDELDSSDVPDLPAVSAPPLSSEPADATSSWTGPDPISTRVRPLDPGASAQPAPPSQRVQPAVTARSGAASRADDLGPVSPRIVGDAVSMPFASHPATEPGPTPPFDFQ
jgi:hypothetical protein